MLSDVFCAFTESAMKRTVCGGTSPTAVTLWPSTTVEKADDEPTRADSISRPLARGCLHVRRLHEN